MRWVLAAAAGFMLGWFLRPVPDPEPAPPAPVRIVRVEGEEASLRARLEDQEALVALLRREIAEQARLRSWAGKERARASDPRTSVAGLWRSNLGPVRLEHPPADDGRPVALSGSWIQDGVHHGRILGGTFDPARGEVRFTWRQDWVPQEGETTLTLSQDGWALAGTYRATKDPPGTWSMTRDAGEKEGQPGRMEDGIGGRDRRRLSVAGTWDSNCGPVTLQHPEVRDGKPVAITGGYWIQEGKYHGRITGGSFDPAKGEVRFTWYQDWDRQSGETVLRMGGDGRNLDGSYTSERGSGRWTLARDGAERELRCGSPVIKCLD